MGSGADPYIYKISISILSFSELLDIFIQHLESKPPTFAAAVDPELLSKLGQSDYIKSGNITVPPTNVTIAVISLINDFAKRVAVEFQLSVLAGEHYFEYIENEIKKIDDAINKLKDYLNKLKLLDQKLAKTLLGILNLSFVERDLIAFLDLFKRLVKFVTVDLDFSSHVQPIIAYHESIVSQEEIQKITDQIPAQNSLRPFLKYYSLFQINVKVASIDDNIGCGTAILYELIRIKNYLNKDYFKADRITEIIFDKCKFLIKKAFYSAHDKGKLYLDESDPSGIKISKYIIEDYRLFEEKTISHYVEFEKNIDLQYVSNIEKQIKANQYSPPLKYQDLYYLAKYYQIKLFSIDNLINKIDSLIKYFETAYSDIHGNSKSNFDRQAYKTSLLFLKNKKLFFLYRQAVESLKNEIKRVDKRSDLRSILNTSLINFNEYFNEIKQEQISEILNYYPFYVYCLFTTELLATLKDLSLILNISINLIEDYILKFRENYRIATRNLEWCKDKHYLLLYMPYEECIDETIFDKKTKTKTKIFLDSSFILPVDYEDKKRLLNECLENFTDNRVLLFNTLLGGKTKDIESIGENLNAKSVEVDKKLNEQDKKIGEQDIKSQKQYNDHVQLLAVFAAIIAFVFGSISVIPKFQDTKSVVVFIIGFAGVMSSFVVTIRILIQERLKKLYILSNCLNFIQ